MFPNFKSPCIASVIQKSCLSRHVQYPLQRLSGNLLVPVHSGFSAHSARHAGRAALHLPLQLRGLHWHSLCVSTWKGKWRNGVRGRNRWSLEPGLCSQHTGRRGERKKNLQDHSEVARRTGSSNMLPVRVKPGNEIKKDRNIMKPFRWRMRQTAGRRKLLIWHTQWSFFNSLPGRGLNLLTS